MRAKGRAVLFVLQVVYTIHLPSALHAVSSTDHMMSSASMSRSSSHVSARKIRMWQSVHNVSAGGKQWRSNGRHAFACAHEAVAVCGELAAEQGVSEGLCYELRRPTWEKPVCY